MIIKRTSLYFWKLKNKIASKANRTQRLLQKSLYRDFQFKILVRLGFGFSVPSIRLKWAGILKDCLWLVVSKTHWDKLHLFEFDWRNRNPKPKTLRQLVSRYNGFRSKHVRLSHFIIFILKSMTMQAIPLVQKGAINPQTTTHIQKQIFVCRTS